MKYNKAEECLQKVMQIQKDNGNTECKYVKYILN